jgi:hypothetical protein
VLECNELVLRSNDRNLQPLIDAGIEFRGSHIFRKSTTLPATKYYAPKLTYPEISSIRSSVKILEDGTLAKRSEADEELDDNDRAFRARLKTWRMLCSFGRFAEISELSKIPLDAIDDAARFGDHDDKMERGKLYGRRELPYQDFDWQAVRDAIETLSGWKERQAELKELKRAAIGRAAKHKITRKTKMVIAEILQFGYETFLDTIEDEQSQSAGAVRLARMRRNRGVPERYTPEMQFNKFIEEAKTSDFNIFDNEINNDDYLDFDQTAHSNLNGAFPFPTLTLASNVAEREFVPSELRPK